jgi:hypothetical protein
VTGSLRTMSETVQPTLTVRLKTDSAGKPRFFTGKDHRHYRVVFEIENAPEDAYLAEVELGPGYPEPLRNVERDPDGVFRLETTAYGDYPVLVHLYRSNGYNPVLLDNVARALRRSAPNASPEVQQAIEDIARH